MTAAPVSVLGLATAVPDHVLVQSDVADFARRIYAKSFARYPKLADVFVNAGIERRYSVRPIEWFDEPHDWSERTQAYLEGAEALFVRATARALAQAGIAASDVDVIVTVSSTGIATPSLEARAGGAIGISHLGDARAGVRSRLRRRRFGIVDRRAACPRRAGRSGAGGRRRIVHAGVSQRPRRQGRRDLLGAVRRRRRGGRAARRARAGPARHRRDRRAHLAGHARHHGLVGRSGWLRRGAVALAAALCRSSGWRRRCAVSSTTQVSRRRG